jgi:hypothetical protein
MSYDSFLDASLDAYDPGTIYLSEKHVLEIAHRFDLGEETDEILRFAQAIQNAFMEENG